MHDHSPHGPRPQRHDRAQQMNDRAVPPGAAVVACIIFSAGLALGAIVASFAWRML